MTIEELEKLFKDEIIICTHCGIIRVKAINPNTPCPLCYDNGHGFFKDDTKKVSKISLKKHD